jgi:hypothetical protein
MIRTYTLTPEEYKNELKRASQSQYERLIAGAKQVNDFEVRLILETEGN